MKDVMIGFVVFAIIFGGALLGMFLGKVLPDPHMSAESRDAGEELVGEPFDHRC